MPIMSDIKRIVLVGHCGFDGASLRRAVGKAAPDREVTAANSQKDLDAVSDAASLLLVNRVLDGGFDAGSGVELIREVTAGDDAPSAMLVSNYDDAQNDAQKAGALPGFGKANIGDELFQQRMADALG
jgi:hypothetical protein